MTFFVLQITSKLTKKSPKTFRLIIASAVGGAYSLIILLDSLPVVLVGVSKVLSAIIIVLIAFTHYRVKSFAICLGVFLFSSFVVLGVIVGISSLFNADYVAVNNSSVYLDISARGLVLAGFVAYVLSSIIVRLYNRVLSKRELYTLVIENNGDSATMLAMLDTGNKLREPFSNTPVIVVDSSAVEHLVGDSTIRYVPASSVNNRTLLSAFKPSKILLKSPKGCEVIENAYIAMSDDIKSDRFSAVLNPEILSV